MPQVDGAKTDLWEQIPLSTKYTLPDVCPICQQHLKVDSLYVGVFPYIHTGVTLKCQSHEFTFCFPYNKAMNMGYTVFDSKEAKRYSTNEHLCPFHGVKLVALRFLGDLVYRDGTKKLQLKCPICNFSKRVIFQKS